MFVLATLFLLPKAIFPQMFQVNDEFDYSRKYRDYRINSGHIPNGYLLEQSSVVSKDTTGSDQFNGYIQPGYSVNSSQRFHHSYSLYFRESFQSKYLDLGNITGVNRRYKYDPAFAGDLSESDHWLYGRVEQAYGKLHMNNFNLFLGRASRNWGPINSYSLILSDYSYSYDHLLFSYKSPSHFKLSVLYAPLDETAGRTFKNPDSTIYQVKRYLVGHRLDIKFFQRFQIALTEMATYGGPDQQFELAFMNPMTFYYPLQRNDRKEIDGYWAIDLFYKPSTHITIYGQFLLDDIIVNNDPGVNDRARYDDRLGINVSFRTGDLIVNGLNTDLSYVRVWNRTYQSKFTWQNYQYRGLGLGYPCASCEEIKLKLGYWNWLPFYLETELSLGRYGNVQLTDLFPMKKEPFPVPPVENNVIAKLNIEYYASNALHAKLNLRYMQNPHHYSQRVNPQKGFVITASVIYRFHYGF